MHTREAISCEHQSTGGAQAKEEHLCAKTACDTGQLYGTLDVWVPDVQAHALQTTMNLLLLGAGALPVGYMAFGFISLVVPPK